MIVRLMTLCAAATLLGASAQAAEAPLDYDFFKAKVQPIFLQKRPDHVRCYVCHSERSNNAFRLEKLSPGATTWNEQQSRRNFEMVSRLVVAGNARAGALLNHPLAPEAGGDAYHSGGRQFASRDDPSWKTLSRWAQAGAKPN